MLFVNERGAILTQKWRCGTVGIKASTSGGTEVIIYSENHTKHTNTLYRQNEAYFNIKAGGTYS
jgi:hypothetical protein